MSRSFAGLALVAWLAGAAVAAPPPVEPFAGERPDYVTVSPSGNYVAIVAAVGGRKGVLKILRHENGKLKETDAFNLGSVPVLDITFKSDERVLVTILEEHLQVAFSRKTKGDGRAEISRPKVVSMGMDGGSGLVLMPDSNFGAQLHAVLPNDPDHVILAISNVHGGGEDLYRVNVNTGESERIEAGVAGEQGSSKKTRYVRTVGWSTTPDGVTYLRYDSNQTKGTMTVYGRPVGGDWTRLRSYAMVEGEEPVNFLGMASPTTVYAADRGTGDARAVWEYDLKTGNPIRRIMAPPAGEIAGTVIDQYKGVLSGAVYVANGVPRATYTDKSFAAAQAALDEALPEYPIRRIVDYSRDHGLLVVRAEGPSQPPVFYLLSVRHGELIKLTSPQSLDPSALGPVETITYPSSDGRQIVAYLALPPGGARANLPLVVMPHGGPEAQDMLMFDGWRQFLATRGYAVLQPQFRGSDGFGLAHERAGHKAWGTLVQDDVRAGIAVLVSKGIVDQNRMCIFGWSYGGYMAMAGAALSPDLYKCAIAGAGVSDLNKMLSWEAKTHGKDSDPYKYWFERMGEGKDRDPASPALFASAVKIPVLLIHGEEDWVVPIEQSEIMDEALRAAGKQVEFVRYPDQRHSFEHDEETDALKRIEAFLAQNLKP